MRYLCGERVTLHCSFMRKNLKFECVYVPIFVRRTVYYYTINYKRRLVKFSEMSFYIIFNAFNRRKQTLIYVITFFRFKTKTNRIKKH